MGKGCADSQPCMQLCLCVRAPGYADTEKEWIMHQLRSKNLGVGISFLFRLKPYLRTLHGAAVNISLNLAAKVESSLEKKNQYADTQKSSATVT